MSSPFNVPVMGGPDDPNEKSRSLARMVFRDEGDVKSAGSSASNAPPSSLEQQQQHQSNKKKSALSLKDATADFIKVELEKPKRPLSAYNIFFAEERKKLLEVLPVREKGKPKDSHGKLGFAAMARIVAKKWKEIEPADKVYFDRMAEQDKRRYNKEMENWRKMKAAHEANEAEARRKNQELEAQAAAESTSNLAAASAANQQQEQQQGLSTAQQQYGSMSLDQYAFPSTAFAAANHKETSSSFLQAPAPVVSQATVLEHYQQCNQLGLFDLLAHNLGPSGVDFVKQLFGESSSHDNRNNMM
eukprot:CAMPEP_0172448854 /NCGR_PEP_ID=MMETSP1065-20121228/7769_1 /TAXON_ID=265537 /ORGANISM="Amphiprora paludosa, Strain CCMP125" /LENGTH=301 /DNA_ID=CAMNT_0013200443 /DNA_START=130 /DNA_END=1035 /DNA_ORIENTATION=+